MPLLEELKKLTGSKDFESLGVNIGALTTKDIIKKYGKIFPQDGASPSSRLSLNPVTKIHKVRGIRWEKGAYHAESVEDVRMLVKFARSKGIKLRVAGSGHSAEEAIYCRDTNDLRVVLRGELKRKTITRRDGTSAIVKVGGGCYLGVNPGDPISRARPRTNLSQFLDRHGLALPVLGGISHQSIGGFLQTGAAGGSLKYGLGDAIEAINIVDGNGDLRRLRGDELNAAAVSMGLCGVVTGVTVRAEPRYRVAGEERNINEGDSLIRGYGKGECPLAKAMADIDYLHLNWFPQDSVNVVTEWIGRRTYRFGKVKPFRNALRGKHKNVAAAAALEVMDKVEAADANAAQCIIREILKKFVPVSGPHSKSTFSDVWYHALPSDDQYETDTLLKVNLMEVWLPMDQLGPALDRLKKLFKNNPAAAGYFITELYGARKSPFWLSPAYSRDVFRVDVFSWAHAIHAEKAARTHFEYYWNELLDLPGARLHWGKALPTVGQKYGDVVFDRNFLLKAYPLLPEWLTFRQRMDPNNVFLSNYWARIFGIH